MGIPFIDSKDDAQPPELVRFNDVQIKSFPDGRRVRIQIGVIAFQKAPNIDIEAYNPDGDQVASTTIIEMSSRSMDVTLHLRRKIVPGRYVCKLNLGYPDLKVVDSREVAFSMLDTDNQSQG
jgi:hypothetical protein